MCNTNREAGPESGTGLQELARQRIHGWRSIVSCTESDPNFNAHKSGGITFESKLDRFLEFVFTMLRAAHPFESAMCGADTGCSAIEYQSLVFKMPGPCPDIWASVFIQVFPMKGREGAPATRLTTKSTPHPQSGCNETRYVLEKPLTPTFSGQLTFTKILEVQRAACGDSVPRPRGR